MKRVGLALARGIVFAAVLLTGGRLGDLTSSPPASSAALERALGHVRAQDFSPIFDLAGRRLSGYFTVEREDRFLEAVFSLSGKWKAVTRGKASYERFIRKTFEKHVFNPEEFGEVLEGIRGDYLQGLAAAENRLLVVLFEDLRVERPGLTFEGLHLEYRGLAQALAPHVLRDLGMNGVALLGSEAASMVLVAALTSAGFLGGGAAAGGASGPWTFGAGLVVGIVAGLALDAVVGETYEDAARMELRRHVNALRNRVIGDVTETIARALIAHRALQERCVRAMFEGGSHGTLAGRP
jgi:hypothetical protein